MEILRKNSPSATLFNRRGFLTGVGATLLQGALIQPALSRFASAQNLGGYPFTLGVASSDRKAGKSARSCGSTTWETRSGVARSRSRT